MSEVESGRIAEATGLSQQAAEPEVSALRASIPCAVAFAIRYPDDSGDELSVAFDSRSFHYSSSVEINSEGSTIYVALEHLEWFISSLVAVQDNRRAASAIEARSDETQSDSAVGESAVAKPDAQGES